MEKNSKQYGLIMPQKANQGLIRPRPSVFNESDSEEEGGGGATDWVKKALKRESQKTFQRKQHQVDMEKALAEDPTVYQYDEVYDKIEEKKAELITAKKQDKKPRYIQSLMLQAEKRKREQERRNERTIQKEREAEGDKFKDKESFVTSAYRAKLEEFKQQEEEERRMDTLEAIADVTKQKDLGGFYRHLYRQTVTGEEEGFTLKPDKNNSSSVKDEVGHIAQSKEGEQELQITTETEDKNRGKENSENSGLSPQGSDKSIKDNSEKKSSRRYRQRNDSSASSDSTSGGEAEKKGAQENLDADSDFSVDSDSSASGSVSGKETKEKKKQQGSKRKSDERKGTNKNDSISKDGNAEPKSQLDTPHQEGNSDNPNKKLKVMKGSESGEAVPEENVKVEMKEVKVKTNIWIKRTVGEVFDSALQRYYERKANKLSSKG